MKEITWTEFKQMKVADIKVGKCLRVIADGEVAFYVVVHPQGGMIAAIEGKCAQIDASRGLD